MLNHGRLEAWQTQKTSTVLLKWIKGLQIDRTEKPSLNLNIIQVFTNIIPASSSSLNRM